MESQRQELGRVLGDGSREIALAVASDVNNVSELMRNLEPDQLDEDVEACVHECSRYIEADHECPCNIEAGSKGQEASPPENPCLCLLWLSLRLSLLLAWWLPHVEACVHDCLRSTEAATDVIGAKEGHEFEKDVTILVTQSLH